MEQIGKGAKEKLVKKCREGTSRQRAKKLGENWLGADG